MIKLFSKIRYKLMEQNKTGKYIKYAIGEIALVMVGILLALQVNNWNEKRISFINEIEMLKELLEDTKADSLFYDSRLSSLEDHLYVISMLNKILSNKKNDSISKLTFKFSDGILLDPSLAYQSSVISNFNNRIEDISNVNIKSILRDYALAYHYLELHYKIRDNKYEKHLEEKRLKYHKFHKQINGEISFGDYFEGIEYPKIENEINYLSTWATYSKTRTESIIKINAELLVELKVYLKLHND